MKVEIEIENVADKVRFTVRDKLSWRATMIGYAADGEEAIHKIAASWQDIERASKAERENRDDVAESGAAEVRRAGFEAVK